VNDAGPPPGRLERLVPPARTLRGYDRRRLRGDVAAGLAVWAAAVPSGLAYAGLAGLPPIVGLYASAVAGLAYALAGTIRQAQVGPTSTSSILTAAAIAPMAGGDVPRATALAALLALMVAAILLGAYALKLGFIADYLSRAVLIGFTAAISLVIIAAQLPNLLGLSGVKTTTFQTTVGGLLDRVGEIDLDALALGLGALALLLVLRRLAPRVPRELIVVAGATALVAALGLASTVHVVGEVPSGLPTPGLPDISWKDVETLAGPAVGIALIAFVETMAIGRVFSRTRRYPVEPRRELLALGLGNVAAGLFQGYPANASFAQTALSDGAGGRTVVASVVTKVAILATLLLLTPLFTDLPYPVLAAVVIAAVVTFIDIPGFRRLLRFQRAAEQSAGGRRRWVPLHPEFWSALITFCGTLLFGILNGILVGVIVTLMAVLYRTARPRVAVLGKVHGARRHRDVSRHPEARTHDDVVIVRFESQLFFANAEYFRQSVLGLVDAHEPLPETVVLVCDAMSQIDLTGMDALIDLVRDLRERGVQLRMCRVKGPVHDALTTSGVVDLIGPEHFYDSVKAARKGGAPDGLPMFGGVPAADPEHPELEEGEDAAEVTAAKRASARHDADH
jgi:sulfate permease, SulP family